MSKLYELSEHYRKMMEMVEDALDNADLEEDDIQMFIDTLESIEDSIAGKVENIIKLSKNLEGDIAAFKAEEQRLSKRRKTLENKVESLKNYMSDMLRNAGLNEVKAGTFKAKMQKSNPSVEVLNEAVIPDQFKEKVADKVLKAVILKSLKDGVEIDGVRLVTDKKHLVIT